MKLKKNGFRLELKVWYQKQNLWIPMPEDNWREDGFCLKTEGAVYAGSLRETEYGMEYTLHFESSYETKLKLQASLLEEEDYYHLIPGNIYGDNNADKVKKGEYPCLTDKYQDIRYCSEVWEFRADRAPVPFSALCCKKGAAALSIWPYSEEEREGMPKKTVYNGIFVQLPDSFGVTLGYTNVPVTFYNRSTPLPSTGSAAYQSTASGRLYVEPGAGRRAVHEMIRREYEKIHKRASFKKTLQEAATGLLESFCRQNYNKEERQYTNQKCRPTDDCVLKPWRNVVEIGWTGGGVLAYPMIVARYLLGQQAEELLGEAMGGEEILNRIADSFNEKTGMLNNLASFRDKSSDSLQNGWWTGYGLVKDCHCAYTVGNGVYYLLRSALFLQEHAGSFPEKWLARSRETLDCVIALQREDGAFGYTFSATERAVEDYDGFAGCWFVPALVYLARLTGEDSYREAAERGIRYYAGFVEKLNCYGSPMDTWKAVDQEGNIAFIRGSRLLYEDTKREEFLEYLKLGAGYEFLWRYCYETRPEFAPLRDGWIACGGSITSVSNPHIHPMGVLVDEDLYYLGEITGDSYYTERAKDSTAWMMQTLELYPEKTGYGRYGVLSERWCPADGLVTERYSDGKPYSSWFSYNLWAAANVLEAVLGRILSDTGK